MAETRRKDDVREDHLKKLSQEKIFEANMASEERVENKRYLRRLQQEQREREIEESLQKVIQRSIESVWKWNTH